MQDYHNLKVWKKAFDFVIQVYEATRKFPREELYGMTDQIRRSAVSVVANIVEGRGKQTDRDFLKYLYIANGSLDECRALLELSVALDYLTKEVHGELEKLRHETGVLLYYLIKSIKS